MEFSTRGLKVFKSFISNSSQNFHYIFKYLPILWIALGFIQYLLKVETAKQPQLKKVSTCL